MTRTPKPNRAQRRGSINSEAAKAFGLYYGGRKAGKTLAQDIQMVGRGNRMSDAPWIGKAMNGLHDTQHIPIEPLGAGLSRILSRGGPRVRYPYGG